MAAPESQAEAIGVLFRRGQLTEDEAVTRILAAYPPGAITRVGALGFLHPSDLEMGNETLTDPEDDVHRFTCWDPAEEHPTDLR